MPCVLAIDQSTSATKVLLFDKQGAVLDRASREHRQHYPQPGWVEHDAEEIWLNLIAAARELLSRQAARITDIVCLSLTNQRETFVVFDRATGAPLHPAIVWQCRRGDPLCAEQAAAGREAEIRAKTGLRLDSYFSGPKLQWLLRARPDLREKVEAGLALVGTIDTYLIYRLTGGEVFATDQTNASRTLLFGLSRLEWDETLCAWWQVPRRALADVRDSAAHFGTTTLGSLLPSPLPICGVMGDSQAALFAQRCFSAGTAKVTFGSGSSVLLNIGPRLATTTNGGTVVTVGWVHAGTPTYVLEGIITFSASTLNWLRDQLGLFVRWDETETMATQLSDHGGVYFVPAFSGLGAPHWRESARAAIVGLTAHSDRRHIVRAALESIAYQLRDVLELMQAESGVPLRRLQGDGGATVNRFLMQFAADIAGVDMHVTTAPDYSPLGAALMGMLGIGVHESLDAIARLPKQEIVYKPNMSAQRVQEHHAGWRRAVDQVLSATV